MALEIQVRYWEPNAAEKTRLMQGPIEDLPWDQRLRLLHLACLDMLSEGLGKEQLMSGEIEPEDAPEGDQRDLLVRLVQSLMSDGSPYKPRHAAIWYGNAGESGQREPDRQGIFRNASLTHLGCLEVIHLDDSQHPTEISFLPLNDLRGVIFGTPALYRFAKLLYDDGRDDEIVLVPLLYGLSWSTPNAYDHDGSLTRFICNVGLERGMGTTSVGVGHQDFLIDGDEQASFGLGSIGEVMVSLAIDDPRFELKCRARGLDHEQARQAMSQK